MQISLISLYLTDNFNIERNKSFVFIWNVIDIYI